MGFWPFGRSSISGRSAQNVFHQASGSKREERAEVDADPDGVVRADSDGVVRAAIELSEDPYPEMDPFRELRKMKV